MTKGRIVLDGHKLAWHGDRVKDWLAGERIAPITIDCALTRRCNLSCVYCYSQLQENKGKELTADDISRFLDDAAEIGVKAVSLVSDGESACSPHIYDAIIRGKHNGLDMALGTNGTPLKEDRLEEILPCLTYIRFNISAGEPDRYAEIHRCDKKMFERAKEVIKKSVEVKKEHNLPVTIGTQMVLLPEFKDQLLPLARLGKELGVDYLVIKHCSDDEEGRLGVDYERYHDEELLEEIKKAEAQSDGGYKVQAKWSKILSHGERRYDACYGAPFMPQFSGYGLVAPCGMLFNDERYRRFHIGNLGETSFKKLWQSDKYWEVMDYLASGEFNVHTGCACLCLQHKVNEYLWDVKQGNVELEEPQGEPPQHINFI